MTILNFFKNFSFPMHRDQCCGAGARFFLAGAGLKVRPRLQPRKENTVAAAQSVGDPNTLNFDSDPGFWPNLNPDPGLYNQF